MSMRKRLDIEKERRYFAHDYCNNYDNIVIKVKDAHSLDTTGQ